MLRFLQVWKTRSMGRTEEFPMMMDTAAFFPGYKWEDVTAAERLVVDLDLGATSAEWAKAIPRQAAALQELFTSKGFRLVGVARVDVCDAWKPVWCALLKADPA